MPSTSFRYHGYTIHISDLSGSDLSGSDLSGSDLSGSDLSGTPTVTYQPPFWPSDPRIVKCPSVDTAKRWIREECRRVAARTRKFQFLKKLAPRTYLIVDKEGKPQDLEFLGSTAFKTPQDARDYAESQDFALFEHFNY